MSTFLQETAAHLATQYPELHRCCLILPSNRSIRILREEFRRHDLRKGQTGGRLMPEMLSIADWMETVSGCFLPEEEEILLQLFEIHHELHPGDEQAFHQFSGNAQLMINDFNDIDLSLADAGSLFSSLLDIRKMEWMFATDGTDSHPSDMQNRYLQFCSELPEYYQRLQERLLKKGEAYQGLMYRQACSQLDEVIGRLPYDTYIFIGFSALSVAEETIITRLHQMGKAEIIIDCDTNCLQETEPSLLPINAGTFIRHLRQTMHPTLLCHDFLHQTEKEIDIYGIPQESSQAELLPRILEKYRKRNPDATCVIVPLKEDLLLPVLYALPGEQANISMEYQMKHTPAYTLLHHYLTTLENMERLAPASNGKRRIYHRDLRHLMENQLVRERLGICGKIPDFSEETALFYDRNGMAGILQKSCMEEPLAQKFCDLFFDSTLNYSMQERISGLLALLQHDRMPAPFQSLLKFLQERIPPLLHLLEPFSATDATSVRYLTENLIGRISIPFKSNPESRLQIMGMLETRALDFEHVILLSVNEGVIPNTKTAHTLLPFDLRQHHHLPTFQNHEAIMTYHFYRLLQRAKHITLFYNMDNRNEVMEKSRLIRQLQNRWEELPNIHISEQVVPLPAAKQKKTEKPRSIPLTGKLLEEIEKHSFSPSSLNILLECPFRFYLQQLLRLQPPKEAEETISAQTMGTVIHKMLEKRLSPDNQDLSDIQEDEIVSLFCNPQLTGLHLKPEEIRHEKNRLVLALCKRYLDNYLEQFRNEQKRTFYEIVHVEEEIHECLSSSEGKKVLFNGVIDRVDRMKDGVLRITDYKTGNIDPHMLLISKRSDLFDGRHKEALQLTLYLLAKHRQEKAKQQQENKVENLWLRGEIVAFQQHPNEQIPLSIEGKQLFNSEDIDALQTDLSHLWNTIFHMESLDPSPGKHCKYCDFRHFCTAEATSD